MSSSTFVCSFWKEVGVVGTSVFLDFFAGFAGGAVTGGVAGGDGAKGDTVGFRDDDDAAAAWESSGEATVAGGEGIAEKKEKGAEEERIGW